MSPASCGHTVCDTSQDTICHTPNGGRQKQLIFNRSSQTGPKSLGPVVLLWVAVTGQDRNSVQQADTPSYSHPVSGDPAGRGKKESHMDRQPQVWLVLAICFLNKSFPFTFQAQGKWNLPRPGNKSACKNSEEEIGAGCVSVWWGDIGPYCLLTLCPDDW